MTYCEPSTGSGFADRHNELRPRKPLKPLSFAKMTAREPQIEELLDHRPEIEAGVSTYLGRDWYIREIQDQAERAAHPAAVLSDGEFQVFAKLGRGSNAPEQFRCETVGLSTMSELAGVLTPTVVDFVLIPHGAILVLKSVKMVEPTKAAWEEAGRSLARLHSAKGPGFGFGEDSYWGDFRQSNRPLDSWNTFFWERWIEPRIAHGLEEGHLPVALAREVERLAGRLDSVCGPRVDPSLVHGDAHQNNILRVRLRLARRVGRALSTAVKAEGLLIYQNNGAASLQEVPHFHLHLVPQWNSATRQGIFPPHIARSEGIRWKKVTPTWLTPEQIRTITARIRANLDIPA